MKYPPLTRNTAGLVAAITVAVATAFAIGAYLYSEYHFESLQEVAREAALTQGELVLEALEHQMLENDRKLIAEMVRGFGGRSDVESLDVLDHRGKVWFSTDTSTVGTVLPRESPPCQGCHEITPPWRDRARLVETDDQTVLRVVVPMENREECHQCHDSENSINGIVILDSDLSRIRASTNRDLQFLVGGSAVLTFLLVGVVAGIVQVLLLKRIHRFENAARRISGGDLQMRIPVRGSDAISWLGREFNSMADSMTDLLREVENQRKRLETVINSIEDGIVVLDPQRCVVAANDAFVERTGQAREDVVGFRCGDLVECGCQTVDCPTLACLDSGRNGVRLCQRTTLEGDVAWEEIHSSPIQGSDGQVVQVVEVWRDISQRRSQEARLAEAHRLASLGMLASGFSHEMSTPLATVLTCLEGILREVEGNGDNVPTCERIGEAASIARNQILRCKRITQHFLRLSRKQTSSRDVVGIGHVVNSVLRLVEPTARAKGITIQTEPAPDSVRVWVDESELQHVLINLLLNAVEACEEGGLVEVRVAPGELVQIQVSDNGRGIPRNLQTKVFEPFVSFREGGTGLGLFLALNFVRQWGGDIRIQSQPGRGSVFEVLIPTSPAGRPVGVAS